MKKLVSCVFIFCLTLPASVVSETLNVGAILILSSDQAQYGKAMQEGIEIALDECNAKLKITSHTLRVFYEDSALRPKQAHTAALKLINQNHIIAGINSAFSEVMPNGKLFERYKVPAITLWDSSRQIEKLGDYNFAIGLWTPSSAEVSSEFARKQLKAKTAVIINTQGDWAETVATLFEADFEKHGGKVLGRYAVHPDNNDFKSILTKTKFKNPDVIYAPLMEDLIPFYKQLRKLNVSSKIVTSDIIAREHIDLIPNLLEGVYQSNAPALEGDRAMLLDRKYKSRYGRKPKLPLFSAWGYDGLMLICEAVKSEAITSEAIKQFLYDLKDFPGLSNTINFTPEGSSPVIEKMFKITEGKFEKVGNIG
ncbi:ABC transporter substrate-binding protein [Oligoflexia bacterium]|nr:ABC transporter substrate-binding protein [Oligoflexia bacterium]